MGWRITDLNEGDDDGGDDGDGGGQLSQPGPAQHRALQSIKAKLDLTRHSSYSSVNCGFPFC